MNFGRPPKLTSEIVGLDTNGISGVPRDSASCDVRWGGVGGSAVRTAAVVASQKRDLYNYIYII